jgi:hypothetical protein
VGACHPEMVGFYPMFETFESKTKYQSHVAQKDFPLALKSRVVARFVVAETALPNGAPIRTTSGIQRTLVPHYSCRTPR